MISPYVFPGMTGTKVEDKAEIRHNPAVIAEAVAKYYGISYHMLFRETRKLGIVRARYVCFLLMHKYAAMSLRAIGEMFGMDHTTIFYGLTALKNDMDTDVKVWEDVDRIERGLRGTMPSTLLHLGIPAGTRVSPRLWEWLMGYPPEFTEISESKPSVTQSTQE